MLRDEAARKKQASVGEVAEVSPRAGWERGVGGGFCRERELCAPHFFAWKKRLREAGGGEFVEVQVVPGGWGRAGDAREPSAAGISPLAGDMRVEVLLQKGRRLLVGPGFDAELVRALVVVLESAA